MTSQPQAPAPRDHLVRFYDSDWYLCDVIGRYVREGLESHEGVVVIATAEHRAGFESVLSIAGVDVEGAAEGGQLALLDAEATLGQFMRGELERGLPDPAAFRRVLTGVIQRVSRGYPKLRFYGEMVDVLFRRGNTGATAALEELWNDLRQVHEFTLSCAYALDSFGREDHAAAFQALCDLHSHVIPAESFHELVRPEDQRRRVAELQQRARALETEIEERKQLERTLQLEQDRLREANRRKDEFLAVLSHELRNPLSPILSALAIMDMRGDPASTRERAIIGRQAAHLARLVEDLLDISRVTQGKVALRREAIEISSVVQRAIEMAAPLVESRAHLLEVTVPSQGLLLEADPTRLAQVVANLLTNAAKYTEPGGRISVSAAREQDDVVLEVKDNGLGIGPDVLPNIFESFVQGDGSCSLDRPQGGLGLGLALVRSLTELHGGNVLAESAGRGEGSRFVVRLPAREPDSPSQAPERRAVGREPASSDRRRGRVLVVDDHPDCALTFAEMIRALGHEVAVAHDGPRALDLAREFEPAVALVDIGLPGMDGFELGRKLRDLGGPSLRLVAVSGYGQETHRARSRESGFDLHVVKPVNPDRLPDLLLA